MLHGPDVAERHARDDDLGEVEDPRPAVQVLLLVHFGHAEQPVAELLEQQALHLQSMDHFEERIRDRELRVDDPLVLQHLHPVRVDATCARLADLGARIAFPEAEQHLHL